MHFILKTSVESLYFKKENRASFLRGKGVLGRIKDGKILYLYRRKKVYFSFRGSEGWALFRNTQGKRAFRRGSIFLSRGLSPAGAD